MRNDLIKKVARLNFITKQHLVFFIVKKHGEVATQNLCLNIIQHTFSQWENCHFFYSLLIC